MSHIDANIRESSLTMLDILISECPNLTASFCQPVILPAFLDLISTKFNESDRKLTLQFNKKMTTNIWRIKVLARLKSLLAAIVNVHAEKKIGVYLIYVFCIHMNDWLFLSKYFISQRMIHKDTLEN